MLIRAWFHLVVSVVTVIAMLAMVAATAIGCHRDSPLYCEGHPDDPACLSAGCTSNDQCAAPTSVCDVAGSQACVQCLAPDQTAACTGTTPVCAQDHTCQACTTHAQCASLACLPDGSSGDDSTVAYVDPAGSDNASCTKAMPCTLVSKELAANRPFVIVAGNVGGGISAAGGATVTVSQSTISGNQAGGISAAGGATVTVSQSTISGNQAGGISVTGVGTTFAITNNYIFRNGDQDMGIFGGVNLGIATAGTSRFEFNTVVDNRAASGATRSGGLICDIVGFSAPNNIIARNSVGGSTTAPTAQTLGACTHPTSRVQSDISTLNFLSPDNAPFSYKLMSGSSAIDTAQTWCR
jgi:hypothetical protein